MGLSKKQIIKKEKIKKRGGKRCNGSVEKPEVQAEMMREPGIQGFSLPLLPRTSWLKAMLCPLLLRQAQSYALPSLGMQRGQNGSFEPVVRAKITISRNLCTVSIL